MKRTPPLLYLYAYLIFVVIAMTILFLIYNRYLNGPLNKTRKKVEKLTRDFDNVSKAGCAILLENVTTNTIAREFFQENGTAVNVCRGILADN